MLTFILSGLSAASVASAAYSNAPNYPHPPTEYYQDPNKGVDPHYPKADTKVLFDQFWENLELCDAEFDYSICLTQPSFIGDFGNEQLNVECTTKFVNDFCGGLTFRNTTPIDNGNVVVTEENCQESVFADSLLVQQKILKELDTLLGVTQALEKTTVVKIQLAIRFTIHNADCVIHSFFNFLNQCATSHFISENDIQCMAEYLENDECTIQETGYGWNINELAEKYNTYGSAAFNGYSKPEVDLIMKALKEMYADISTSQKIHFVETKYDSKKQQAKLNVCTSTDDTINSVNTDEKGVEIGELKFHFPVLDSAGEPKKVTIGTEEVLADPFYEEFTCKSLCTAYFDKTKADFIASLTEDDNNNKVVIPDAYASPSRCFAIKGYDIFYIESGKSLPLSYTPIENILDSTQADAQCYSAHWEDPRSCASHLSQWRMTAACCKSYYEYYLEKHTRQYSGPHYEQYNGQYGYPPNGQNDYQQQHYQNGASQWSDYNGYHQPPTSPKVYYPEPAHVKINPDELLYDVTVASSSSKGPLLRKGNAIASTDTLVNVEASIDELFEACLTSTGDIKEGNECDILTLRCEDGTADVCQIINEKVVATCVALTGDTLAENPRCLNIQTKCSAQTAVDAICQILGDSCNANAGPFCTTLGSSGTTSMLLANSDTTIVRTEYSLHPTYIGDDPDSKAICKSLDIDLDFSTIIPLVSGKCNPQACALSQLTSCMDQPQADFTYAGPANHYYGPNGNYLVAQYSN